MFRPPSGISPEQWPLDPLTGYPLVHGFTLRLPVDYRCHGPDIAGFSFFASCSEHGDGGTTPDEEILSAMTGSAAPADVRYLPFWTSVQKSHPKLSRMSDILDDNYAVILLTEGELNGPVCRPPDTAAARVLSYHEAPKWLEIGNGRQFFNSLVGSTEPQRHYLFKVLGGVPEARLDWSRALRWSERAIDPNAGKPPQDPFTGDKSAGYQQHFITKAARSRARTIASTPGPRITLAITSEALCGRSRQLRGSARSMWASRNISAVTILAPETVSSTFST